MSKPDYKMVKLPPAEAFEVLSDIASGPSGYWFVELPASSPYQGKRFELVVDGNHQPFTLVLNDDGTWYAAAAVLRLNPKG